MREVNMFFLARDKSDAEKSAVEQAPLTKQEITEDDEIAAAVKLIAENERNSQFRDKRSIELDKVRKQAHHTRGKIRVKFPDTYIL
jgi:hypothetical protein